MVFPILLNYNDVIWPLFDPVEIYKKVHGLRRVLIRKNNFCM